MKLIKIFSLAIILFIAGCSHAPAPALDHHPEKYNVTIYRDTWGVPHIFGETDVDAAFGLAYAHAEDDLANIQGALLAARGKLASVYGKSQAPNDYMVQLLEIWPKVNKYYHTQLSPETQAICNSYSDGINQYMKEHPEEVLPGVYPVNEKDIIAGFVHKTPLFFGVHNVLANMMERPPHDFNVKHDLRDVAKSVKESEYTKGSNVFAVAPSRSEDNKVRLAINSHQPWDGQFAWYEAHIHSEEGWNMIGGLFPGSPVVLVGHNDHLGWGHTVNAPDLIDVYELELHPKDPYLYKFDEDWKRFKVKDVPIEVRLFGLFNWTFYKEALWSVHGPVMKGKHATYAVRIANYDNIQMVEQWYKMNKASNFDEWKTAMEMIAVPMFNSGYADEDGNIFFVYSAKLPKRAEGFDWSGVLPGNTSETLWSEYLTFEELPQVMNPKSGFIQNCNNTPFMTTTGDENPDRSLYSETLGIESRMSNRGLRAMELFGSDEQISRQEFEDYKYDLKYSDDSYMSLFVHRLVAMSSKFEDEKMIQGIEILKSWDLNTDIENLNASLPIISFGWFMEIHPDDISDEILVDSFTDAVSYLYNHYGKLDVMWGNVNRLIRGDVNLGLAGGPDIAHAVYGLPNENGQIKGWAGDAFLMLVEWGKDGVSSESIHQYGSNTQHQDSKHYADQTKLFVERKLKPVWRELKSIKANLEKVYRPGRELN